MKTLTATLLLLLSMVCSAQTIRSVDGTAVGPSSGNVSSALGKTIGTASGNVKSLDGLAAPAGGGSTATVSELSSKGCYPATTCTVATTPGVAAGDLVLAFLGSDGSQGFTTSWTGCSSSGNSVSGGSNITNSYVEVSWCIASSTAAPTITGGSACSSGNDCGIVLIQARSTSGFNTSTFLAAGGNLSFTSSAATGTSVTTTAAVNFAAGFLLDEAGLTSYSAGTGWTAGAADSAHIDMSDYQLNVAAGAVAPAFKSASASSSGQFGVTAAMGAN